MATIAVAILIGCEHPRQQVIVQAPTPTTNVVHVSTSTTSTTTRQVDWQKVGALAYVSAMNKIAAAASETGRVSLPAPSGRTQHAVSASSSGFSKGWDCVANAETSGDWHMTGSMYSSALGVMNQAVRENAPADVAARILSGTASRQEQIDMAQRIVDRFGVRAWAAATVAKCA